MADSIENEIAVHIARNEKLVELIEEHGASLDEDRAIDFFFYVNDRADAEGLAQDLSAADFRSVEVLPEQVGDKWSVHAERFASVLDITAADFVESLVQVTMRHRAEFDGWGSAL